MSFASRTVPRRLGLPALAALLVVLAVAPGASRAAAQEARTWGAPALTNPLTVTVQNGRSKLNLLEGRDYRLVMPRPVTDAGGVVVVGGRNVVLDGGRIDVPSAPASSDPMERRGLYLKGQTGTVYVASVAIGGATLAEGIDLDQRRGATVVLQDIDVATVHGSYSGHHADVLQTWAGPRRLLVDGLRGATEYQGLFLLPNQHFDGPTPELFDLRHVRIDGSRSTGYLVWGQRTPHVPTALTDVVLTPRSIGASRDSMIWPKPSTGDDTWRGAVVR
jgi:hypothetical protein